MARTTGNESYNPTLTFVHNYDGTTAGKASPVCGNINGIGLMGKQTSVWSFKTDGFGAASFSIRGKYTMAADAGSTNSQTGIRFNITSSDTSYINKRSTAGVNTAYGGDGYWYSVSMEKKLMPNTTYYLWTYPGDGFSATWFVNARLTLSGAYGTPSNVTAADGEFGTDNTITVTPSMSGLTHSVSVECAGITTQIAEKSAATSFSWETDLETYARAITDAHSATATITCTTFYGSANWGTKTKSITMSFPDAAELQPILEQGWVTLSADNSAIASPAITNLVQGYSKIVATFDTSLITCVLGSTLTALKLTVEGRTLTASPGQLTTIAIPSATLQTAGQLAVECVAVDSRGIENGAVTIVECYAYSPPAISAASVFRCDQNGAADDNGAYLSVNLTGSYALIDDQNAAAPSIAFRSQQQTDFGPENAIQSLPTVANYNLDPDVTYYARLTLHDLVGNAGTYVVNIPTQNWLIKARMSGNSISAVALGKAPEHDSVLEIPSTWEIQRGQAQALFSDSAAWTGALGDIATAQSTADAADAKAGAIKGDFITDTFQTSIDVSGNDYATKTFSCSKSGYRALGVVGFTCTGAGSGSAVVRTVRLSAATTVEIVVRNVSTTNRTWTFTATVLFVKN